MNEEQELLQKVTEMINVVDLGIEAKQFLSTDLGKYLITRAQIQRKHALESLLKIDPADTSAVRSAQNKALIADSVIEWINLAIEDGQSADASLKSFYDEITLN